MSEDGPRSTKPVRIPSLPPRGTRRRAPAGSEEAVDRPAEEGRRRARPRRTDQD